MKMEKMYVAPEVEVLLMEVELGFAGSGLDPDDPNSNLNGEGGNGGW